MGSGFCTPAYAARTTRCLLLAGAVWCTVTHAQLVPSFSRIPVPTHDSMERAQRQADSGLRWIKAHAD